MADADNEAPIGTLNEEDPEIEPLPSPWIASAPAYIIVSVYAPTAASRDRPNEATVDGVLAPFRARAGAYTEADLDPAVSPRLSSNAPFINVTGWGVQQSVVLADGVMFGNAVLPSFTAAMEAFQPFELSVNAVLPAFTAEIDAENQEENEIAGAVSAVLPAFIVAGDVDVKPSVTVAAVLPSPFRVEAEAIAPPGAFLDTTLPAFTADAMVFVKVLVEGEARLPGFTATGELMVPVSGHLEASTPAFTVDALGGPTTQADIEARLQAFFGAGEGIAPIGLDANITLPRFQAQSDVYLNNPVHIEAVLPAFTAEIVARDQSGRSRRPRNVHIGLL